MDSSILSLYFYIFIWVITLYIYQRKRKYVDAGSVMILAYLGYSIFSFLDYSQSPSLYPSITLFPFLYLYIMIMIAMSPVLRYNQKKLSFIKPNMALFHKVAAVYIICALVSFISSLPHIQEGLTRIIIDSAAGQDIYNDTLADSEQIGKGGVTNIFAIIRNTLVEIGFLMFFFYCTLPEKNKWIFWGLLISIISSPFGYIAISQRGPAIESIYIFIITYFLLREHIPSKINKLIKGVGIGLILTIFVFLSYITISRFGDNGDDGVQNSVFSYAGMANLNFNMYGLDDGGIRYGDRTVPVFKKIMGFDNVPSNFIERRHKYPHLKINDEVFIGFVGDFTIDFGPFIAPILFILFTFFVLVKTRPICGKLYFHQLLLIHFVTLACFNGGMKLFSYADLGNLKIISLFIAYALFKWDVVSKSHTKEIKHI